MPRNVSAPFAAAFAGPVTRPVHLVEISGLPGGTLRWCDTGLWGTGADIFVGNEFELSGFTTIGYGMGSGPTIKVQNVDGVFGKLVMDSDLSIVRVKVFIGDSAAQSMADVENLGEWTCGGLTIDPSNVSMALQPVLRYAPRRMVTPAYGFNSATPIGTRIEWGGEIYTLGD
jgi:hypothetical protein